MSARLALLSSIVAALIAGCPLSARSQELLVNGSFEEGDYSPTLAPTAWSTGTSQPPPVWWWDDTVAHTGTRSVKIASTVATDAWWQQDVTLAPNTMYLLSGWVRTQDVAHTPQVVDAGASLCLMGAWLRTPALVGTHEWTYVRLVFNSGTTGRVTIGARLGFWSGQTTGTAWFDDLRVTPIKASDPHPQWKILALIYKTIDFTPAGGSRLVGTIPAEQMQAAADAVTRFVRTDIPALTSGNMTPVLTIRYPEVLSNLSPFGGGWWPSASDTLADRDPAFDSVIVIWQPTVVNQSTGQTQWIGSAAGLTPPMGIEQTYTTLIIEAATTYGHLNVFKHEWGHSILFYFDAADSAPKPAVNNHTDGTTYVHCGTGALYTWLDETDANPIPNSIYNDLSGFTHDYYSGTTALASNPGACLGITPLAWAIGGPVSKPGDMIPPTPQDLLAALRTQVEGIVAAKSLPPGWSKQLDRWCNAVPDAINANDGTRLQALVQDVRRFVMVAVRHKWLSAEDGQKLQGTMDALVETLGG